MREDVAEDRGERLTGGCHVAEFEDLRKDHAGCSRPLKTTKDKDIDSPLRPQEGIKSCQPTLDF